MAKIHKNAIALLAAAFGSHDAGLPEWLKNAREAYLRAGTPADERVIIVNLIGDRARNLYSAVECIDFVGVCGDDIDSKYLYWADPEAASRGARDPSEFEGGQGNGGKAYLRQMFKTGYFLSIYDEKLSVVGFLDRERLELGFYPDESAKDSPGDSGVLGGSARGYAELLNRALERPAGSNITIVRGIDPKGVIDLDKVEQWIQRSPQARLTLMTCQVRVFVNGAFARMLAVKEPDRHPDFPTAVEIEVPQELEYEGVTVFTARAPEYPRGKLLISIARQKLRGRKWQGWSHLYFQGSGVRVIGGLSVRELGLKRPDLHEHIWARCWVPILTDPEDSYETQSRQQLKPGPLSKALYLFIGREVDRVLDHLAKVQATRSDVKEKKDLQRLHDRFSNWIDTKLTAFSGVSEFGEETGGGKKKRKKREKKEHAPPTKIRIHRDSLEACTGADYELRVNGYDAEGRPVPTGSVVWKSNDPEIVRVDPNTGKLRAEKAGRGLISCKTVGGLQAENGVLVNINDAVEIKLKTKSPARVGPNRRLQLETRVKTADKKTLKNPVLKWQSTDVDCVRVTQDGKAIGGLPGAADVTAFVGPVESEPLRVEVVKGMHGDAPRRGAGKPQILLSGVNPCPFTGHPVDLDPTDPPIHQRPGRGDSDANIFWINLQSPLAKALYDCGVASLQWRSYHFQRIIDVYATLMLREEFGDNKNLDVVRVLEEFYEKTARIYEDAAEDEILNLLSSERIDLGSL